MIYSYGDGFTYWGECVLPIQAESPEAALVEFSEKFQKSREKAKKCEPDEFEFCGKTFHSHEFYDGEEHSTPEFLTLDEWYRDYQ